MNAKVLPLPVGATHITSEPRSIAGHTAAWTDVGVENGRPLAEDAMWSNCASLGATTLPGGGKAADGDDGTEEGGDEEPMAEMMDEDELMNEVARRVAKRLLQMKRNK